MPSLRDTLRLSSLYIKTFFGVFRDVRRPVSYLYDRFFDPGERTYIMRDGTKISMHNKVDRIVLHEVWINRIYSWRDVRVNPGDIVVDIGGHRGIFTLLAAKEARHVYSFEPVAENFRSLVANIKQNRRKNVTCINQGVMSKPGNVTLFLGGTNSGAHSIYKGWADSGAHVAYQRKGKNVMTMKVTSLPVFMKKEGIDRIDFLKIDCEGSEYEIMFRMPERVLRAIDRIGMEYHRVPRRDGAELKRYLEKHGFRVELADEHDAPVGMLYAKNTRFSPLKRTARRGE